METVNKISKDANLIWELIVWRRQIINILAKNKVNVPVLSMQRNLPLITFYLISKYRDKLAWSIIIQQNSIVTEECTVHFLEFYFWVLSDALETTRFSFQFLSSSNERRGNRSKLNNFIKMTELFNFSAFPFSFP